MKLAEKNLQRVGLIDRVELKQRDIFSGIDENEIDLVVLDMADSEKVVQHAFAALRLEGKLVGYHPHVEQVKKFVDECKKAGFVEILTIESNVREWLIRDQGCRPANTGLTHTGFLTFASKPPLR